MSASLRPVPGAVGGREVLAISFTLSTTEIEVAQEVLIYSGWQFVGGILGFMAGLLGFSVVTCCEFCDNGLTLRRKRKEAAARNSA